MDPASPGRLLEEAGIPLKGQALYHCLRALALRCEAAIAADDDGVTTYGPATVEEFTKLVGSSGRG